MNAKPGSLSAVRRPTTQKVQSTQLPLISGWYLLYMRVCDIVVTDVALWLAAQVRQVLPFGPPLDSEGWLALQTFVIAPLIVAVTYATNGQYRAERLQSLWSEIR